MSRSAITPAPAPSAPAPQAAAPEDLGERLLSLKDLRQKIGVATSTIYRWMTDRQFPEPLQITDTMVRWKMSDIDAWINARPTSAKIGSKRRRTRKVS